MIDTEELLKEICKVDEYLENRYPEKKEGIELAIAYVLDTIKLKAKESK